MDGWSVRLEIPFSYKLSKNSIWGVGRGGGMYLKGDAKRQRDSVTQAVAAAIGEKRVAVNKLWIGILVQKPDHRGDAVNVVDTLCDGIKRAIPLDDRWYSISYLDWEISRVNPRVKIELSQHSGEDHRICSKCNLIMPNSMYRTLSARECLACHPEK